MVLASTSVTALLVTSTFCKERQHMGFGNHWGTLASLAPLPQSPHRNCPLPWGLLASLPPAHSSACRPPSPS